MIAIDLLLGIKLIICLLLYCHVREGNGICQTKPKAENFHRLGLTRFWIKSSNRSIINDKKQWSQTFGLCKLLSDEAVLPILDKISSNAIIARHLERIIEKKKLIYYTYWIGAKGGGQNLDGIYNWFHTLFKKVGQVQIASNIFYRAPRKIGSVRQTKIITDESKETAIDTVHTEQPGSGTQERCLAFSLPFKNKAELGWQVSWVERDCNFPTMYMCEIPNEECNENDPVKALNPHVLTEDRDYYYTDGNWVFSKRRFIVNWKPRNKWEAERYCDQYNLKLFAPTLEDICLIPYLKMWGMVLSTYHFWTSYLFNFKDSTFRTENGTIVQRGAKVANQYIQGRFISTSDDVTQVSYIWSYERTNETRCKELNCKWMYYILAPIQETMRIGTICQPKEIDNTMPCDFEKSWNNDFYQALKPTALVEFGYRGSGFWRSTYKQTFDNRDCQSDDRQMLDIQTDYWSLGGGPVEHLYDYLEAYWVVDQNLFQHAGKHEPLCTITNLTKEGDVYTRELKKVYCDEWHFYMCELAL